MSVKSSLALAFFCVIYSVTYAQHNDDVTMEYLHVKHGEAEIAAMQKNNPAEYHKLYFYYGQSWMLIRSKTAETNLDMARIDVSRFEDQRLENERAEIVISQYNDKLILLSKKELEAEYKRIESEY